MTEARTSGTGALLPGAGRPVRGAALADQAYALLRDAILSHRLPPGTRLSVPDVAHRLGISRSPVREAIARIANDGLAHFEPHRGAIVADLEPADLVEIYELREVLEGLACRLAAAQLTDADLEALTQTVRQHEAAVAAGDVDQHMDLDREFHGLVRRIADRPRLSEALDRLQGQIRIAMHTTRQSPGGMEQAVAEHRTILAALGARDGDAAEHAGREHIARLRAELSKREHEQ